MSNRRAAAYLSYIKQRLQVVRKAQITGYHSYMYNKTFLQRFYYLRRRLASGEGIVTLAVTQCVCPLRCV